MNTQTLNLLLLQILTMLVVGIAGGYIAASGTRTVDLGVAVGALLVFSPLFLLLAIAIRSDSPGPVFYRRGTTWVNRRKPRSDVGAIERRKLDRHAAAFH